MSLLGVYVIIAYYFSANKSQRYQNKITDQRFDISYLQQKIDELRKFQSDALHWNLLQAEKVNEIGNIALNAYRRISKSTGVRMKSENKAMERIQQIYSGANEFKLSSRRNSQVAQIRESITEQPKELVNQRDKSTITISNYLGSNYFLTCDEAWIEGNLIYLAECKHSSKQPLPSKDDIKDGLIKMVLFTNLDEVLVEEKLYQPKPILRLTSSVRNDQQYLNNTDTQNLLEEAKNNNFSVLFS